MWLLLSMGCDSKQSVATYYQDVKPILDSRCVNCHVDGAIGGFNLADPETVVQLAPLIAATVENGQMPPWPADSSIAYSNDWSLNDEQIETILSWDKSGALLGDPENVGEALDAVGMALSQVDYSINMPESYTPIPENGDDYRCFVIDWTLEESKYITGFNAVPGNLSVVHHIAAFLVRPDGLLGDSVFEQVAEWDAADPEPGYPCFGGPAGPGATNQIPIEQIAQWVPGSQGWDFPNGTGIQVDPGSQVILQLHYYAGSGINNTTDQTSLDFALADNVQSLAAYAPYLNGVWPVAGMDIPAGESEIEHEMQGDPRGFFGLLNPNLELDNGFMIHSMMLHMHRLGRTGEIELLKANGEIIPLLYITDWDFDWQLSYFLETPVLFEDGDELRLRCVYDNSAPNATDITWGEGSGDEMCVGNLYISEL